MNRRDFIAAGAAAGLAGCAPANGGTMRIVVGSGPGSASDSLARIFARHLQRFDVQATVEDQPAAGGKLAARRLATAAPTDDLMAFIPTGLLYSSLLGEEGVDWDMASFGWLGSFSKDRRALVVTRQAAAPDFPSLLTRSKPLILAATAAASPGYYEPLVIAHLTGARLKVVPGFEGGARNLALVSGEAQGIVGSLDGLQPVLDLPGAHILLRINDLDLIPGQKGAGLDAPALRAFAKGDDAAPLLELANAHAEFGRIAALPPGAPAAKLALWRSRTAAVMDDPAFRQESAAAGFSTEPTPGEAVSAKLTALLSSAASGPIRAALHRALAAQSAG